MVDIAQLGIQIDSSPATKAAKELDALTVSATRADAAADDLATTSRGRLAPGMAAGGHQSKMMAMQLSQVAQQAGATGNWIQALAIQLPDMALGFGAVGIAAGVLASVTLPLLASMFSSSKEEVKTFTEQLDALRGITDQLKAAQDILATSLPDLYEQYGTYALRVREAALALVKLQTAEAQGALRQLIMDNAEALDTFTGSLGGFLEAPESINATLDRLVETFSITRHEAVALRDAFRDLRFAESFQDQAIAMQRVSNLMRETGISADQLPPALRQALIQYNEMTIAGAELTDQIRDGKDATLALVAAAPGGGWLAGAIADAATLAGTLWDAALAAEAARDGQYAAMGDDERGSQRLQGRSAGEFRRNVAIANRWRAGVGGGGGGGGGTDEFRSRLDALVETLRSEREIEDEWYQENLAILKDRRAQEILGKQAHDAALLDLHREYQSRIAAIDAEAQSRRLGEQADFFGALAGIAQAGGQRMAKAAATFGAIEGTINAYRAALQAMADPTVGFWGKFAAYANVLGAGLKGVAAIRAAGGIGGGTGGGLAAQGATAPVAGPAVEYRVYGIDRDAQYSGAFWEKIWNGIFEEGKRRGVTTPNMVFV